jgi:fumarate reductase subunit D
VAQYSAAVVQFVGRALTLGALPEHDRRRIAGLANQILTPLVFLALAVLAYKFWA